VVIWPAYTHILNTIAIIAIVEHIVKFMVVLFLELMVNKLIVEYLVRWKFIDGCIMIYVGSNFDMESIVVFVIDVNNDMVNNILLN